MPGSQELKLESVQPTPGFGDPPVLTLGRARLFHADCMEWLSTVPSASIQAVVTDPPYGLVEYSPKEQHKLRSGRGGVWRLPPSFDGCRRSPLPRFTTLTALDLARMDRFFRQWGKELLRVLVPGAHVMVASNPLVVQRVTTALVSAGFEPRGQIIRLVMTMRGGDRPKNAHDEFSGVTSDASVNVGTLGSRAESGRRARSGQSETLGHRWLAPPFEGPAIRRCHPLPSDQGRRAGAGSTPVFEAPGIPSPARPCLASARKRHCAGSFRGLRFDARRGRGRGLCKHRRRG